MQKANQTESLRNWLKRLEERPGVYVIQSLLNESIYVGSAKHSIRQRLLQNLACLQAGDHDVTLFQEDWSSTSGSQFIWMMQYAASPREAVSEEIRLIKLARALEDFGSYNRRTTVSARRSHL